MSNKTCPVCGAAIVAGQRFCGECGSRLATTQESAQGGDAAERNSVMHRPGGGSPDPFAVGAADAGFGEDDDFFSQFVPKSSAPQQDAPAQPAAPEEFPSRRSRRRFNPNVYETGAVEDVAARDTGQVPPMFPQHVDEATAQPSTPPETAVPQQSAPAASPFEQSGEPVEPKTRQMSLEDIQNALGAEDAGQSAAGQREDVREDAREQEERARAAETWQVDPDRRRVADEATFTQLIEGLPDDPADHPISSPKYVQDDVQQGSGQQEQSQFQAPQPAQSPQQAPAPTPTESGAESAFAPLPQAEVDPQQREQQERANAFFTDAPTERAQAEQVQQAQAQAAAAAEQARAEEQARVEEQARAEQAAAAQARAEQERAEQAAQQQAAAGSSMPTLPPLPQQNQQSQQQGWAQPQPPQSPQPQQQPSQDAQDRELSFDSLMSEFDESEQQSARNQQTSPASTRDWRASDRRAAENASAVGAGTGVAAGGGTGGPGGPTGPGGPGGSGPQGPENGEPKYTPQEVQRRRKGVMTILIAAAAAVVLIIGAFGINALFGGGESDPAAEGGQTQTSAGTESTSPTVGGDLGDGGPTESETETAEPTQESFDPVTFQSGSGNIRCQITQETGVACQLTATNFAAPAEMCQNGLYSGASVGVTTDGATYPCLTGGFGGGQALGYDTPITAGPYTCSINYSTGVNCDNGDGDGFSMEYSAGITINGDMAAEPQPEVAPVG